MRARMCVRVNAMQRQINHRSFVLQKEKKRQKLPKKKKMSNNKLLRKYELVCNQSKYLNQKLSICMEIQVFDLIWYGAAFYIKFTGLFSTKNIDIEPKSIQQIDLMN